ncbi:hypothetical protein D3C83_128500 [compost metagenome]
MQPALVERLSHTHSDLADVERLGEIITGSLVDARHRRVHFGIGAQNDDRRRWVLVTNSAQKRTSVATGHT